MLGILVGMDEKDSSAASSRPRSSSNAQVAWLQWVCWWMQFVLCPFCCRQARRQVLFLSVHSDFLAAELVAALIVDNGGMCMAGFSGTISPRAEFLSVVGRPKMLGILAGMNPKDRHLARCGRLPCCGTEANLLVFGILQLPYIWWLMSLLCSAAGFTGR